MAEEVTTGEVETKIMDNLKLKSSCEWDNMSTKLMKSINKLLLTHLQIIKQALKTGIFADKLNKSYLYSKRMMIQSSQIIIHISCQPSQMFLKR